MCVSVRCVCACPRVAACTRLLAGMIWHARTQVIGTNSAVLAPIAVDAVLKVIDIKTATTVDLSQIKVPLCFFFCVVRSSCVPCHGCAFAL